jgi:hypothetical protein
MKAMVRIPLPGFTGGMEDIVIYYNSQLNRMIARRKVIPKITPNNDNFTAISKLAKTLGISDGFIDDCRKYVRLYNQKYRQQNRCLTSWNNVFFKMLLGLKKQRPELDLSTLTLELIYQLDLPVNTVAEAISAELLDNVRNWQDLVQEMGGELGM